MGSSLCGEVCKANHENTQLPRFNSRFWRPGTEAVDAFCVSLAEKNNWLVPPFFLIPSVLNHMVTLGGCATLVVPANLVPRVLFFWPLTFTDEGLSPISLIFSRSPWVQMYSFWVIIEILLLDHLISVQGFCFWAFLRQASRLPYHLLGGFSPVSTLSPHGIWVAWDQEKTMVSWWDPLGCPFCGPFGPFH